MVRHGLKIIFFETFEFEPKERLNSNWQKKLFKISFQTVEPKIRIKI
jgi:hypothetical protein